MALFPGMIDSLMLFSKEPCLPPLAFIYSLYKKAMSRIESIGKPKQEKEMMTAKAFIKGRRGIPSL